MARKGRRRRYQRGAIEQTVSLGTLGAGDVITDELSDNVAQPTWISSVNCTYSLSDVTLGAGGPVLVGVCHDNYSAAQVEEFIENEGNWDQTDLAAQEIGRRKIRIIGSLEPSELGPNGTTSLNDGKPITTKCGWLILTGSTLKYWFYNQDGAAFATTNPSVFINGHANLWPRG